ncbi:hypothetical protein [Sphingomonas sanguinis]|uniref:hypothetical protein n=1 Tax=Sphingomonas sanguinis TaxID=33051 RepID=UPI00128F9367|nr:hypothetical protein [Sphingomonas sanguinis]
MFADVAIASVAAAVHKDRAFQASSPKNFSAGPLTGLFFGRDFPYGKRASSADNQKESEIGSGSRRQDRQRHGDRVGG